MRKFFVFCLSLLLSTSVIGQTVSNCVVNAEDTALFNLLDFTQRATFSASDAQGSTVSFSFCSPQITPCNGTSKVFATYTNTQSQPSKCENVGGTTTPSYRLTFPNEPGNGVSAIFKEFKGSDDDTYALNITLLCDKDQTNASATVWTLDERRDSDGVLLLTITGKSNRGCAVFTISEFMNFLSEYKIVFVCVFFVVGTFIALFGFALFNLTVFILTTSFGTFISGTLFFELVKFNTQGTVLWVVFGTCLFIGCILGYLAIKYEKVAFFALGFVLGGIAALLLYQGILATFLSGRGPAVLYVFMILMGLIGGGLALLIWKSIVIIATSLIGSYMSIRSLSVYIGGFPDESKVAAGLVQFDAIAYAYIAVIVLCTIGAACFQFKNKQREDYEREEAYPQNIYKNMMDTGY